MVESGNGWAVARCWIRNITDKDDVTGQFVNSLTLGLFGNDYLTKPRIMGLLASCPFED